MSTLTETQITALTSVFGGDVRFRNLEREVARARHAAEPSALDQAILKAIGETTPTGYRASAAHAGDDILLGMDAQGRPLTVDGCHAADVDPLVYLTTPGAVLNDAGRSILRHLRDMPTVKAKALGVDVAAVDKYARRAGIDPSQSLSAEIGMREQLARDRSITGSPFGGSPSNAAPTSSAAPAATVEELYQRDKALAARLGITL